MGTAAKLWELHEKIGQKLKKFLIPFNFGDNFKNCLKIHLNTKINLAKCAPPRPRISHFFGGETSHFHWNIFFKGSHPLHWQWVITNVSNTLTAWDDSTETAQQEEFIRAEFARVARRTAGWRGCSTLGHSQWALEWWLGGCFKQWIERHFVCLVVFCVGEKIGFRVVVVSVFGVACVWVFFGCLCPHKKANGVHTRRQMGSTQDFT